MVHAASGRPEPIALAADGSRKSLILVAGVGRSGTSAFTSAMAELGFVVPQPEVRAKSSNPRGFGEPRWVVQFHRQLLKEQRVRVSDERPRAWQLMTEAAADNETRERLTVWLGRQFASADRVIIKDPRIVWFLSAWNEVSSRLGVRTAYATLLRPPAEVVSSHGRWYGAGRSEDLRLAGWVNVMLGTEKATRRSPHAFVGYADLLTDWRTEIQRTTAQIDEPIAITPQAAAAVDKVIDPSLHRERTDLADLDVSPELADLAARVWDALERTRSGARRGTRFDRLRVEYRLYCHRRGSMRQQPRTS
jgi:hypothetical protein